MKRYAQIENGLIVQISCREVEGYIEVPEHAVVGMSQTQVGDGTFLYADPDADKIKQQSIAQSEYEWAAKELDNVDLQLKFIASSDSRAVSSPESWYEYARSLRDYCSRKTESSDVEIYIVNDISSKYTVDVNGRPIRPSEA